MLVAIISAAAAVIAAIISVCGSIWNTHINRKIAKAAVTEQKEYVKQALLLRQQAKFAEIEFNAIAETLDKLIDYSDKIVSLQSFIKAYETRRGRHVKRYINLIEKAHENFMSIFNKKMFYMDRETAKGIGYCAISLEETAGILTLGVCMLDEEAAEHIGFKKGFVKPVEQTTVKELAESIYSEAEEMLSSFTELYNKQCDLQAARFEHLKNGVKVGSQSR